jgi:hypothetical protein
MDGTSLNPGWSSDRGRQTVSLRTQRDGRARACPEQGSEGSRQCSLRDPRRSADHRAVHRSAGSSQSRRSTPLPGPRTRGASNRFPRRATFHVLRVGIQPRENARAVGRGIEVKLDGRREFRTARWKDVCAHRLAQSCGTLCLRSDTAPTRASQQSGEGANT